MRITAAPKTSRGFREARPGDVASTSGLTIIDVRETTRELVGEVGHIHGVRHVPLTKLLALGLPDVPLATPIVIVCRAGRESAKGAESLVARGYTEVYLLVGGMIRWNAEEHPVARTATWR